MLRPVVISRPDPRLPPRPSPSLSTYTCLSQSAATTPCSSSELWFRRVRYAGAALLTRNAHFNPARQTARQSDSLTVVNSFATIMIVWLLISSSRSSSTGLKQRRLRPLDTCRLVKCWVLNMFPANCSADNKFCSIYIKESPHSILLVCIARRGGRNMQWFALFSVPCFDWRCFIFSRINFLLDSWLFLICVGLSKYCSKRNSESEIDWVFQSV